MLLKLQNKNIMILEIVSSHHEAKYYKLPLRVPRCVQLRALMHLALAKQQTPKHVRQSHRSM